jgi:hypothetical protein
MFGKQVALVRMSIAIAFALGLPSCGGGGSSGGSGLTGIDVAPLSASIVAGSTQQYTATGHFSNGPDQDLTNNATWSSSVTSVATINNVTSPVGLATGVAAGQTMISAAFQQGSSSVTGSTDLTVTAAGPAVQPGGGIATVLFRSDPRFSGSTPKLDGHIVNFSDGGFASQELPAGVHRIISGDGTHTFTMKLQAGRTYSFEVRAPGRLELSTEGNR